jgi:fibro-slime domain-containing protein
MSTTWKRHSIPRAGWVVPAVVVFAFPGGAAGQAEPPDAITVTGIVRDFKEWTVEGGHPDFERRPNAGYARYSGNVATTLDNSRKPAFTGEGHKVANEYYDLEHRPICYALYDPALGDTEGSWAQAGTGGIQSAETFAQWYRDDPELNMSQPLELTLVLQPDGNYVFDDEWDPYYIERGGFFPIDDQLFGNSPGIPDHNFHFTFELHLECEYDPAAGQFFMFTGDDDVFVYVNGQLVIDLGGVHAAHDQYVDMNRLGLPPGETYLIDFYFAERHRPQSNFRIETNIPVRTAPPYNFTAIYD